MFSGAASSTIIRLNVYIDARASGVRTKSISSLWYEHREIGEEEEGEGGGGDEGEAGGGRGWKK